MTVPVGVALAWTGVTVAAYVGSVLLHRWARRHPVLSPVVVTALVVTGLLELTGTSYGDYLEAVVPLTVLLAVATVALAVPLHAAGESFVPVWRRVAVALACAAGLSIVLASVPLRAADAPQDVWASVLPLSVTTPVSMEISSLIGGDPALSAGLAIVSGILGAMCAPRLLTIAGVSDPRARGLAIGITSHGIGTSRVLTEDETTGAWSSAGMVLHALVMTVSIPVIAAVWG